MNNSTKQVLRIRDVFLGSRIRIFFRPESRIQQKEARKKIFVLPSFFVSINLKKINITENFLREKNILDQLTKNLTQMTKYFTQIFVIINSQKCGLDPVSEIWKKLIPDPGVKQHRIPGQDPQHCTKLCLAISRKKSRKVFRRLGYSMTGQFSYRMVPFLAASR
jgi:hypothetical protein